MEQIAILVSSAGRRVELVERLRHSAGALGLGCVIVAIDRDPALAAACHTADLSLAAPPALSEEFPAFVEETVRREGVRLAIPTIDTELAAYAGLAPRLAALGCLTNVSTAAAVAMFRDKLLTMQALDRLGVSVPRTATLEAALADRASWTGPIVIKPRGGSSSIGLRFLDDADRLEASADGDPIVQQRIVGAEFTVNMFAYRGEALAAVPHRRIETRSGEVSKGITRDEPGLDEIARRIAAGVEGIFGVVCFQAIVAEDGRPYVFEINGRFGGGAPLAMEAGAPLDRWLIQLALERPLDPPDARNWQRDLLMLRHDRSIFVGDEA